MQPLYTSVKVNNEIELCEVSNIDCKVQIERALLKNRISYYIRWGDNEVQVLSRGEEFSHCRHIRTGYEMDILTKYLYSDEDICKINDSTDLVLELHPGDEVSVIEETSRGYFVKHKGTSGWYFGELE